MKRTALALALSALLAACTTDSLPDDTAAAKPQIISGVFLDAATEGLEYSTTSHPAVQYTQPGGFYFYQPGDEITFKIGGVVLGKATASAKLSPADLSGGLNDKAINIAQLLQTLDNDGDPANGIKIEAAQRDLLKSHTETSLKLAANGTDFGTELTKLGLKVRDRNLASEHFESTLASQFAKENTSKVGEISATKHQIVVDPKFNVAYPGTMAGLKAAFPTGFPFSMGSALAFKGKTSDGAIEFYVLSDRGPNADSPNLADGSITKVFPAPDFTPKFGVMRLKDGVASLVSVTDILNSDGSKTSGRPSAINEVGSSTETPLSDTLQVLATDKNGIDPEGMALDKNGDLWICDEYGPYLIRIDPKSGKIAEKLFPGAGGLPAVLANRQPNRGFEGIAIAPGSGKIYAAVQSNLEIIDSKKNKSNKALFTRITEYDPATKATRMFAYPIDASYAKSKELKIGDLLAISDTRFLLIEQGIQKDGLMHRSIYLIDISSATDLSGKTLADKRELEFGVAADLANIQMVKRSKLFDYDAIGGFGYLAEKSEGLTMIDGKTIAIVNDNDFDIKASLQDAKGKAATDCVITAGKLTGCKADSVASDTVKFNIGRGDPTQAPSRLWLFKLPKDIKEYSVN